MKNAIYIFLLLGGCATFSNEQTAYYHRFAAKPTITEEDLGNGQRRETISNPYDVTISVNVDCDNEFIKRHYTIKNGRSVSFTTKSDMSRNCSPTSWVVE